VKVYLFFNKTIKLKKLGRNSNIYFVALFIFLGVIYLFVFHTNFNFKYRTLEFLGTKDTKTVMEKISSKIYRNIYFLQKNNSLTDFNEDIWYRNFDPKDPYSWRDLRIHKIMFPLTGKNVDIVPFDSKGYLMDSTCNAFVNYGEAYSITTVGISYVKEKSKLNASVFCFVSNDFNGNWVSIQANGKVYGKINDSYDLNSKGTWQKLSFSTNCDIGEISVNLYFLKALVKDFSTLKGYVIFAYPVYQIIPKDSLTLLPSQQLEYLNSIDNNRITNSDIYKKFVFTDNLNKSSILNLSFIKFVNLFIPNDPDILRNWIAKYVSEDTTYHPLKSNIKAGFYTESFGEDRISRWKFAWQIFTKEYNWKQKIFGGGFNFLNWYGYYFLKDKTKSDYPHNPFLYILLYSGIIGLLLYLFLLYKVFYYYIKYIKEYYLFFIFFLITYFFTFFSGGNPFDPPIMGFFMILPFFVHYIHKKEKFH
ncbi:MAG: hypothetical protein HOO91_20225, partial [Bacteroidales bacterium]|nr:hypothetical protein [Bacteroidales bacterium]